LVTADEADSFRLTKYKKPKRLLKKTHKERDIAGCISCLVYFSLLFLDFSNFGFVSWRPFFGGRFQL